MSVINKVVKSEGYLYQLQAGKTLKLNVMKRAIYTCYGTDCFIYETLYFFRACLALFQVIHPVSFLVLPWLAVPQSKISSGSGFRPVSFFFISVECIWVLSII